MSQTEYSNSMPVGEAGDLGASCNPSNVATRMLAAGKDPIPYGRAVEADGASGDANVVLYEGNKLVGVAVRDKTKANDDDSYIEKDEVSMLSSGQIWVEVDGNVVTDDDVFVRKSTEPHVFTVTWNADFVALNKINGTVNGVAIAEVTFAVDHATTLAAVATAIQNLAEVATATVTGAREITVTGVTDGQDLTATGTNFTVTLGASQATEVVATVTGPSASNKLGVFRADDGDVGNGATADQVARARFLTAASAGGVALLEINLP